MDNRKKIGSLFCFCKNLAWNRTAIRTQIRTRVDGPLIRIGLLAPASIYSFHFFSLSLSRSPLSLSRVALLKER
jgi:hypothetical protein